MRILDSKDERDQQFVAGAPRITEYLCADCREHLETVRAHLTARGVELVLDDTLVRGLDYYTRTAWEWIPVADGRAQATISGGGRYDGLAEQIGGKRTPGVGFGCGIERLVLALEKQGRVPEERRCDWFIAVDVPEARPRVGALLDEARAADARHAEDVQVVEQRGAGVVDVLAAIAAQQHCDVVLFENRPLRIARERARRQQCGFVRAVVVRQMVFRLCRDVRLEVRQPPGDSDAEPRGAERIAVSSSRSASSSLRCASRRSLTFNVPVITSLCSGGTTTSTPSVCTVLRSKTCCSAGMPAGSTAGRLGAVASRSTSS